MIKKPEHLLAEWLGFDENPGRKKAARIIAPFLRTANQMAFDKGRVVGRDEALQIIAETIIARNGDVTAIMTAIDKLRSSPQTTSI